MVTAFGPGQRLGPYLLDTCLASGSMSELFTATRISNPNTGSARAVLKLLSNTRATDRQLLALFLAESNLVVDLRHPNLVCGRNKGEHEGAHFLELELVEGLDLSAMLKLSAQPLGSHHTFYILDQVLTALCFLHDPAQHGFGTPIIHRDVTPDNILVSFAGEVKLTDLGIALHAGTERLAISARMGKPSYLSPEQRAGSPIDARADLYQVGLCALALLSGRETEGVPVVPQDTPAALASWLQQLLAPDPRARFRSAADALVALRDLKQRGDDPRTLGRYLMALSSQGGTQQLSDAETANNVELLPDGNQPPPPAPGPQRKSLRMYFHVLWILPLIVLLIFLQRCRTGTPVNPGPDLQWTPSPPPAPPPIPIPPPDAGVPDMYQPPAPLPEIPPVPPRRIKRKKGKTQPPPEEPRVPPPPPPPPPRLAVKEYISRGDWESKHAQLVKHIEVVKAGHVESETALPLVDQHQQYVSRVGEVIEQYITDARNKLALPPRKHTCTLLASLKVLWGRRNEPSWKIELWLPGIETQRRHLRALLEPDDKDADGKRNNTCND